MNTNSLTLPEMAGKPLRIGLWVAQTLLAVAFCMIGLWKFTTPIPDLAAQIPWAGQYPPAFVRSLAVIDFLGGIGVLLPALTRIVPRVTVVAALGCTLLQTCAIAFHVARGEFGVLPLNAILISLSIFVLWGRARRVPIVSR